MINNKMHVMTVKGLRFVLQMARDKNDIKVMEEVKAELRRRGLPPEFGEPLKTEERPQDGYERDGR